MIPNNHYTYILLDPRIKGTFSYDDGKLVLPNLPIYIGKGINNRCFDHLKEAINTDKNSPKLNKIRKIIREGHEPTIIKILKDVDEQTAIDKEIELIWVIGRDDLNMGPLTNLTWGGDGGNTRQGQKNSEIWKEKFIKAMIGHEVTSETREKISKKLRGRKLPKEEIERRKKSGSYKGFQGIHTEETKKKIGDACRGRISPRKGAILTSDTKEKIRQANLGKTVSDETRKKLSKSRKGITTSLKGRKYTEEEKARIYGSRIGRKRNKSL